MVNVYMVQISCWGIIFKHDGEKVIEINYIDN